MSDFVGPVAYGAIGLSAGIGLALSLAVSGAMVEAVRPGALAWVGPGLRSGLSMALNAFMLVGMGLLAFLALAGVLAVSLVRWAVSPVGAGRPRSPVGAGRPGSNGRHRADTGERGRWTLRGGEHRVTA